jgi:hypothetical protein
MSGMNQEIADLGIESYDLTKTFGQARIGGAMISYEPKALASMVTTIRTRSPKRYLSIDLHKGAMDYIVNAANIDEVKIINHDIKAEDFRKLLRDKDLIPFDLISLDLRNFPLSVEEVWRYIIGFKEPHLFGKGKPTDYGNSLVKSGTIIIFNFLNEDVKNLYFKNRTLDNRLHQSEYAGMIKWA